jgi:hypothetical protein
VIEHTNITALAGAAARDSVQGRPLAVATHIGAVWIRGRTFRLTRSGYAGKPPQTAITVIVVENGNFTLTSSGSGAGLGTGYPGGGKNFNPPTSSEDCGIGTRSSEGGVSLE